jgi:hypothetical protein
MTSKLDLYFRCSHMKDACTKENYFSLSNQVIATSNIEMVSENYFFPKKIEKT